MKIFNIYNIPLAKSLRVFLFSPHDSGKHDAQVHRFLDNSWIFLGLPDAEPAFLWQLSSVVFGAAECATAGNAPADREETGTAFLKPY